VSGPIGLTEKDLKRFREYIFKGHDIPIGTREVLWFERWLTTTPEGDEALRHINETPRQRFLPFESQEGE